MQRGMTQASSRHDLFPSHRGPGLCHACGHLCDASGRAGGTHACGYVGSSSESIHSGGKNLSHAATFLTPPKAVEVLQVKQEGRM